MSPDTEFIRVIITHSKTIEAAAITLGNDVLYCNQNEFVEWAHRAIQVVRNLRLDYIGPGNESWGEKAMAAYREFSLDPVSIKEMLSKTPIIDLKQL